MKTILCLLLGGVSAMVQTNATDVRNYYSDTIAVYMAQTSPGFTTVYLTEHGDADEVIVDAFYWTSSQENHLMLHKEVSIPLVKGVTAAGDLPLNLSDIVFIRVKEMKLLTQNEFGRTTK